MIQLPKTTTFETIILALVTVVTVYATWCAGRQVGRQQGHQFATTSGYVNSAGATDGDGGSVSNSKGTVGDQTTEESTEEPSEADELVSTLEGLSTFCGLCAHPDHQCSDACTSPDVIATCEKLNGYANLPRVPCPLQGEGIRTYAMFRGEPHMGMSQGTPKPFNAAAT